MDRINLYTNPSVIDITWERGTPFPSLPSINISALNGNPSSIAWNVINQNTAGSYIVDADGNFYGSIPFNHSARLHLHLINLEQHPNNTFQAIIWFTVIIPGQPVAEVSTEINITITGDLELFPKAARNRYSVIYNRSTNELKGDTIINIVDNPTNKTISLNSNPNVFQQTTGTSQLELKSNPINPIPTHPAVPQTGTLEVLGRLKEGNRYSTTFVIDLLIVEDDDIHASVESIYMEQNLDNNVLTEINFTVLNPFGETLSISAPNYVTVTNTPGNYQNNIRVRTNPSGNTTPEVYVGKIILNLSTKTLEIPLEVLYTRTQLKGKTFALDGVKFEGAKIKEAGVFVRVNIRMKFNVSNKITETESSYLMPYVDGETTLDIGKIIHDFHPRYNQQILFNLDSTIWAIQRILHPAEIVVNFEELDIDYQVLFEKNFPQFKVYPGKRPKLYPILSDFNTRSQFDSFTPIFTVISKYFDGSEFVENFSPINASSVQDEVQSLILKRFHHLKESFKSEYNLNYLPVPAKAKQYVLQFLNQNLVPDWFIFSGNYIINTDHQHTHDEFVPNAKKYQTKSKKTLSINTGLILKEEEKVLDAIIESPLCFIKIKEVVYECFATTTKRIIEDSDRNLTEHNIEFQIIKEWMQDSLQELE